MKRLFMTVLLSAALLMLGSGMAFAKTLKVGTMGPLTGPYAADGNDIKNGVLTAVEVFKANGGIPGFDDIEVLPQDTACEPRQAVATANKLINEGANGVVGSYCSSATLPASEVLDEESIIMITPASTNEKVTSRGLPYMFRMCGRDDDQGAIAVKFMVDKLKAKSIYIVDDKTAYSQGLADGVEKMSAAAGIKVLGHEHVNQGDKDFSAILTKVKTDKPDVFYMSMQNSATGALMLIQAKRMGITAATLAQDAVYHPQLIEIAKEAAENVYLTFGFIDDNAPAYKEFYSAYQPKFGSPGAYSGYAYDSAMAYLKAVKAAGSADPAKVKVELMKLDYDGATKHIKFKDNGDSGSNYIIRTVKDGKFRNYWNPATDELY
ncbi:branched-chain amino acid ABC transporter substrate-binding protein [Desulfovibrio gilichinskyi]|uniref:Branched-chain amino acid transport system substrate-binding protein n=1 Tax=Desulfovibrio gilichinskyi TaxID=1519643 RepID=A0A1X7E5W9_9BACT|nr:branched-chain amino acid ABC transporter substrate-binding protein [Desulfovibrio gilichinskyi]SMF27526.1 branched-chain amino acid transport system substrate-binding protein [Desulfovibrio gilichinskyi]